MLAPPMAHLHISDLEAAINWWRLRQPPDPGAALSAPLSALAGLYGQMAYARRATIEQRELPPGVYEAWLAWYHTTPDAPCIAICSTTQGDDLCKGCGRTFDEVQHWTRMTPVEKRHTWWRITQQGTAWRFNRYAERVQAGAADQAP